MLKPATWPLKILKSHHYMQDTQTQIFCYTVLLFFSPFTAILFLMYHNSPLLKKFFLSESKITFQKWQKKGSKLLSPVPAQERKAQRDFPLPTAIPAWKGQWKGDPFQYGAFPQLSAFIIQVVGVEDGWGIPWWLTQGHPPTHPLSWWAATISWRKLTTGSLSCT